MKFGKDTKKKLMSFSIKAVTFELNYIGAEGFIWEIECRWFKWDGLAKEGLYWYEVIN